MSIFAHKKNQTSLQVVRPPAKTGVSRSIAAKANDSNPSFNHHFSRLPVHSPAASSHKGESGGGDDDFAPIKGEPDVGNEEPTPMKGEDKKVKKVKKTEVSPATAGSCGQYSWKVQFSVENADDSTNGYIVQKINAVYSRTDCDGKDKPVTGIGKFPYWEAWGVRKGKVYIGDSEDLHKADTYSDNSMGDSTKGSIVVTGVPEFFPDAKLPDHMKANNPDTQALSLRSSLTDPALKGGTGAIGHDLTASWNCCSKEAVDAKEKKTTFSNQK